MLNSELIALLPHYIKSCKPVESAVYHPVTLDGGLYTLSCSYLFWVQQGRGVHRIDLADFKLPRQRAVERILTLDLVSSIAIDYTHYRLFFPNESSNTMMSSALDGTDVIDIRHDTQNPDFITVKSLAYHQVAPLFVLPCIFLNF